jgi:biotin transport system substrate-specific component
MNYKTSFIVVFAKLIVSVSIIYVLGIVWLGILIGWDKPLFEIGVFPFLLAELFKISILAILASKLSNLRKII